MRSGVFQLQFDGERVTLPLILRATLAAQHQFGANAFSLAPSTPSLNPALASTAVFTPLEHFTARDASLTAWVGSEEPQQGLNGAGVTLQHKPGHGLKGEILTDQRSTETVSRSASEPRSALVIGAGLAGTSVAERLAARGWRVTVIDEAAGPGEGASGNRAGVFRPLPSLDDNRLARITRAGFLYGLQHLARLAEAGHPVRWSSCGVLHLARDAKQEAKMRAVVEAHGYSQDYLRFVDRDAASSLAGRAVEIGGWWFPSGGWIQPPSLCAANLAVGGAGITTRFGTKFERLERSGDAWIARDAGGSEIARAPVVVLANGVGIRSLPEAAPLPVRPARGQVSHLPAEVGSAPRVVVCRLGYVSPEVDGVRCAGATFIADDDSTELRESEHRENLAKLDFILPGYAAAYDPTQLDGRVGFRPASPDRLPMIGAIPAVDRAERTTALAAIPRHPGLYAASGFGARGLVWASLAGELLASLIDGGPLPLEQDLVDAMDPARYLLKPPRPGGGGDE